MTDSPSPVTNDTIWKFIAIGVAALAAFYFWKKNKTSNSVAETDEQPTVDQE